MINKMKSNKGFSLVELLVSISLLTIMAVAFLPLLTTSYSGIQKSGERNNAINLAQQEIEQRFSKGAEKSDTQITIRFPGVELFKIEGEIIIFNEEYGEEHSVELDVFIPEK